MCPYAWKTLVSRHNNLSFDRWWSVQVQESILIIWVNYCLTQGLYLFLRWMSLRVMLTRAMFAKIKIKNSYRGNSSCRDNESQHIKGPESLPYYQISTESGLEGPFSLQKHNEKHQDFCKILTRIVAMQHLALFLFLLISSKSFLW